jgi:hypothetical protein
MNIPYSYLAVLLVLTLLIGVIIGDRLAGTGAGPPGDTYGWSDTDGQAWRRLNVAFNRPQTMSLGSAHQVTVVLDDDVNRAIRTLVESFEDGIEGRVARGRTWAVERMMAKLYGKNFRVEAQTPEEQKLVEGEPATWTWHIEPKEQGARKLLRLELYAIISRGKERLPPMHVQTYDARIDVSVGFWEALKRKAQEWQPFGTIAGGWDRW